MAAGELCSNSQGEDNSRAISPNINIMCYNVCYFLYSLFIHATTVKITLSEYCRIELRPNEIKSKQTHEKSFSAISYF